MSIPAPRKFRIRDETITLGQLSKVLDLISSGADAKSFLAEGGITLNGEEENRRGRKLRAGDVIRFANGLEVTLEGP